MSPAMVPERIITQERLQKVQLCQKLIFNKLYPALIEDIACGVPIEAGPLTVNVRQAMRAAAFMPPVHARETTGGVLNKVRRASRALSLRLFVRGIA